MIVNAQICRKDAMPAFIDHTVESLLSHTVTALGKQFHNLTLS